MRLSKISHGIIINFTYFQRAPDTFQAAVWHQCEEHFKVGLPRSPAGVFLLICPCPVAPPGLVSQEAFFHTLVI